MMRRAFATLILLLSSAVPALGQGTGAGFAVPSVEDALARIAPRDTAGAAREAAGAAGDTAGAARDTAGAPSLLRRGGTGLAVWGRSPSALSVPGVLGGGVTLEWVAPDLRIVHNSALPHAPNEGSLWAARGPSARLLVGGRASTDRFELTLAPEITWSHNGAFQIQASSGFERHPFASPWHVHPWDSADLPLRPGAESLFWLHPGQSSVAYLWERVRLGIGTENRWWGPGLVNALVLGGDAPGFPHAFLETRRPLATPLGDVEAAWIWGTLVASPWFSAVREPGPRTVSGLAVSVTPVAALRLGLLRLVVRPGASDPLSVFDAIVRWDAARESGQQRPIDHRPDTDQVTSVFFQLAPAERVEVYGEWARMDPLRSVRGLFQWPQHSQGYTVGFQWRSEAGRSGRSLRVQAELTNLEQSRIRSDRPVAPPFYTGRATDEGLTHRGRVLGAAVGPGAQSQHLAFDLLGPASGAGPAGWRVGLFGQRVRWENDTFARLPMMTQFSHDISLMGGVRGARRAFGFVAEAQVLYQSRLNYLFQNGVNRPAGLRTVDVTNWTFGLTLRPAGARPW